MSILTDAEIAKEHLKNKITVNPWRIDHLGSNSYDLTLDSTLRIYKDEIINSKTDNELQEIKIPLEGLVLQPGKLYLGSTVETFGSLFYVPIINGKNLVSKLGIRIHATSGIGDLGYVGKWDLQIDVVLPVKVYPKMKIAQVFFLTPVGTVINPYNDKKKESNTDLYDRFARHNKGESQFQLEKALSQSQLSPRQQRFLDSGIVGLPEES